jgi:L-lactate dehydrogenase (cytochrome)
MTSLRTLNACHSILDLREVARRRLPAPIFDFLDGGAETEWTMRRNTLAFDHVQLVPKCLIDVASVTTSTRVLGQSIAWPVLCSPTGTSRLFHGDGELAVARAAANSGTLYGLSTGSTYSLEEVARASTGAKIFQLYIYKNREITYELIERAKRSNYAALCLTVDVPVIGKRERDLRSGFALSPTWSASSVLSFARHPGWVAGRVRKGKITVANFAGRPERAWSIDQLDTSIAWNDVRGIIDKWDGPFALKGVMSTDDALRAADMGVTAVIVSNHGGRQLDGAAAPIEVLEDIANAVGDRIELILDGGVRRGVHVLKALALGAKACSIGRPYLYGLSAGGEAGVTRALGILRDELVNAMKLAGCPDIAGVGKDMIRRALPSANAPT